MSAPPTGPRDPAGTLEDAVAAVFARHPGRMVPDLDRIRDLLDLLGEPQRGYGAVHLTGTNGKTSTTAMVASLLEVAGLTPGAYSSPHLQDVRERIRVAGAPISRQDLARHLAYLQPFLDVVDGRHPDAVTFFEVLTAAAYLHFADVPVDVAVVEVGMGGTWDATNVLDAGVAVLLRVALDHRELGSTPAEIAGEKVGIITEGARVVSAVQDPEVLAVVERRVAEVGGDLKVAGRDFEMLGRAQAVGGQQVDLRGVLGTYNEVHLPLFGRHQAHNAAVALAAFEAFGGYEHAADADLVQEGFASVRVPGRLEPVPRRDGALVLLDGAHNPAGAAALAEALAQDFAFERRVGVLGVLEDKDVEGVVAALAPVLDHVVAVAPDSERAADPSRISAACEALGLSVEEADDAEHALGQVEGVTRPSDGVVVTGSLYLVGEVRGLLGLA
jgi:dihydrofolate synthase / folylpolyglutamate synthase